MVKFNAEFTILAYPAEVATRAWLCLALLAKPFLVPRSVRYNPISVSSVARSGRKRKHRSSERDDSDNSNDDIVPASTATASNKV